MYFASSKFDRTIESCHWSGFANSVCAIVRIADYVYRTAAKNTLFLTHDYAMEPISMIPTVGSAYYAQRFSGKEQVLVMK